MSQIYEIFSLHILFQLISDPGETVNAEVSYRTGFQRKIDGSTLVHTHAISNGLNSPIKAMILF